MSRALKENVSRRIWSYAAESVYIIAAGLKTVIMIQ